MAGHLRRSVFGATAGHLIGYAVGPGRRKTGRCVYLAGPLTDAAEVALFDLATRQEFWRDRDLDRLAAWLTDHVAARG